MSMHTTPLVIGSRVRVTQQTPLRDRTWSISLEGEVVRYRQAKTGAWFAGSRDDRLWLDRLELRLDDGELVVLNLDQFSVVRGVRANGESSVASRESS
jgi:hypothetical protein